MIVAGTGFLLFFPSLTQKEKAKTKNERKRKP
jgi:hypothetical protein